ncbi:DMSO/TMAO reductase YedYZ, molybdopterin-dependent catalytic subunit [Prauserella aidingensis]|uniref:molybdopterin-dependent oxidoreductase n=1 Tax=Prauserella aidingensis TaxID=387890 RepID=UPI0020A5C48D|nr:molybdopterin-dependent oxidoreductase [Prauserella aidingensis]MCP2252887.1 DMSO/TMAO reductase YedYZ, molybdopterin-dependent catalytic subunit [Prauserella aidingensis]
MAPTDGPSQRPAQPPTTSRRVPRARLVVAAVVALAAALAAGHLVAAFVGPQASPPLAVGNAAIDLTPSWLKDFAIATFGTADKLALLVGMGVVLVGLAVAAALASRRGPAPGTVLIAVVGVVGLVAVVTRPDVGRLAALAPLASLASGVATWLLLHRRAAPPGDDAAGPAAMVPGPTDPGSENPGAEDPGSEDSGSEESGSEDRETLDPRPSDTASPGPAAADARTPDPETSDPESSDSRIPDPGSADAGSTHSETPDRVSPDPETSDRKTPAPASPDPETPDSRTPDPAPAVTASRRSSTTPPGRRRFLVTAGGAAVVAGVAGLAGRFVGGARDAASSRASAPPLDVARELPAPPHDADFAKLGTPTFLTPNDAFYRIDTALSVPQLPVEDWRLRIHGMVDRELELTYDDVRRRGLTERRITLCCVSNPVGGELISTATFTGVDLGDLLRDAGVRDGAQQLLSTSSDGWTCGTPLDVLLERDRGAMLALGMNGEPLPLEHGFPARLVVPGLYGYVSATKWVTDLEVTTWNARRAYWLDRGWAREAPVKTQSRIDRPAANATMSAGRVIAAGIAWAQHTGIAKVEVRLDGGRWREATLSAAVSDDTWRMWHIALDVRRPGGHRIACRATDKSGYTQTSERMGVLPDGATGHHAITFTTE